MPYLTLGEHDPNKPERGFVQGGVLPRQEGPKNVLEGLEKSTNTHAMNQADDESMTLDHHHDSSATRDASKDRGIDESIRSRNQRKVVHKPMTLDQYYYPTIFDTSERDNDQVISKYISKQSGSSSHKQRADQKQGEVDKSIKKILMVDQLWIWIIDESMFSSC